MIIISEVVILSKIVLYTYYVSLFLKILLLSLSITYYLYLSA